ncbi:TetR-like C-terminal domain-containing protein [Paenibacillus chondroitinus]|uniref:TetR-like C-terminal domain-containing protein n=1 Tax=Paenibacillus chondroitinus TaxID=59842 RepID=A0ABU6DLI6_9BACL|nr:MULTISPECIES: TetR-like C-terminal domain-containing protein [Paenibacillus]MCY9662911.1 WHG domain-containing protein [Paenibacillus anseongense]MEB4798640.1 TetR-like C-terminal domain-containing protein [Paenibacillus chondroitinus]
MAQRQGLDAENVLQAAVEMADTQGVEGLTLAALAAKLNVKTPSLYNHIKGLPDLRTQLSRRGLMLIKAAMVDAVIGKAKDDALLAVGFAYVDFARKHPGLYEAISILPDYEDPELKEAGNDVVFFLLRILEPYGLSEEDALHVVRGFRSMVHGFASLEHRNGFRMGLERDESLRRLLQTYLRGLRTTESAT